MLDCRFLAEKHLLDDRDEILRMTPDLALTMSGLIFEEGERT